MEKKVYTCKKSVYGVNFVPQENNMDSSFFDMNKFSTDKIRAVDAKFEAQKIAFAPLCFQAIRGMIELGILKAIEDAGAYGVGISSFGPVLYTMFDESNADIVEKTKEIIGDKGTVFVTKAQNHGFVIEK